MKRTIRFILNNRDIEIEENSVMSTLSFLREKENLKSVKLGCGEGECGACTVLLGEPVNGRVRYRNVASCILPLGELEGKHIVTLEGINGEEPGAVQKAMLDEGAIQCGFCTPGFVMSLTGFFLNDTPKTNESVLCAIDGNICRCTGYFPIKRAAEKLVGSYNNISKNIMSLDRLIELSYVPSYFSTIYQRLLKISEKKSGDYNMGKMMPVAGATDLFIGDKISEGKREPLFLSQVEGMSEIKSIDNQIYIGGGATTEDIKNSPVIRDEITNIEDFFNLISSSIIRNRATLGGNIVNASPIGDLSVFFLALDSVLGLGLNGVSREVKLKDFFIGYKVMDLKQGEIIRYLRFKKPEKGEFINFEKVSRRRHLDIASCNSAIKIKLKGNIVDSCSISAGGVAPVPLYLKETSSYISGKPLGEETVKGAVKILQNEISPISDIRGSSKYKSDLLGRLLVSHFVTLFPERFVNGELL